MVMLRSPCGSLPAASWRGRMAGQPLRVRGACVAFAGDWSWNKHILGLRGWKGEGPLKKCCWLCGASLTPGSYDDACLDAAWRRTHYDMARFWTEMGEEGRHCSAMWTVPGMVLDWVRPDFMHTVDLGVVQYLSGCVCFELFLECGGKRSVRSIWAAACARLDGMARTAARELNKDPPGDRLSLPRIRAEGAAPKLKMKAADGRHFFMLLVTVLELFFPPASERERLRLACVRSMRGIYEELENWEPATSPETISQCARRVVMLTRELHRLGGNPQMWRVYPKHHLMIHVCESTLGSRLSPKLEWCYSDEDVIGQCAKLCGRTHPIYIGQMLIARYRILLFQRSI